MRYWNSGTNATDCGVFDSDLDRDVEIPSGMVDALTFAPTRGIPQSDGLKAVTIFHQFIRLQFQQFPHASCLNNERAINGDS